MLRILPRFKKNQRGFTLLEVMIAFVIFVVGMLAVTKMQLGSIQSGNLSHNINSAGVLASKVLEDLTNSEIVDYVAVVSGPESGPLGPVNERGEAVGADEIGFYVSWVVTPNTILNTDDGVYKEVVVTVTWQDIVSHSIILTGYVVPNRRGGPPLPGLSTPGT